MAIQDDKETDISEQNPVLENSIRIVSFKEEYLGHLIEAEALLEILGKIVTHHDDVQMTPRTFMGISILLDKISLLIDIDANLVDSSDSVVNAPVRHEAIE